ncbi:hypothetical protein BGZ63DRAFT_110440 [Mariannaea sp. PMI_226]|nr:hypothetical protein BGZ63DRAFT_110440 [Mariannaea sp. PMI_226]
MESKAADLLQYAQEYASKDVDLYDLLGIDALTPKEDIHRAWRKRSLKYHPDKAGDNFDAEKWQLFERARDVLTDPDSRAAYDNAIKAVLLRRQEREAMDQQRKHFVDDLEARENAWKRQKEEQEQKEKDAIEKERSRLQDEQRMREAEEKRQADAAQELEDLVEAKRRLKEKKERKKQDEAREKFLRKSKKAASAAAAVDGKSLPKEPLHGVIAVPGDYEVDLGTERRKYWELVCDKLRAVQAVRNLSKQEEMPDGQTEVLQNLQEAKLRMHQAEVQYAEESRNTKEVGFEQ